MAEWMAAGEQAMVTAWQLLDQKRKGTETDTVEEVGGHGE